MFKRSCTGYRINNPLCKAILGFKLNSGSKESAILLSKMLHIDGKPLEEKQTMSDYLKVNDVVFFDCHIYDKGGVGSGKDRCNYFAMKAWKNEALAGGQYKLPLASNTRYSTGWLSEIYPRSGVITFISNTDERVSFSAAKMYLYEKRLGSRQSLTTLLNLGDQVFFEAVPNDNCGSHSDYCSWQANLVWKGKRPQVDPNNLESLPTLSRKDSLDSSSSSDLNTEDSCSNSGSFLILPTSGKLHGIVKGTGMVAKIVSANAGVIWWVRRSNHFESVWFEGCKLFKYGENLANKKLSECIREGKKRAYYMRNKSGKMGIKGHTVDFFLPFLCA